MLFPVLENEIHHFDNQKQSRTPLIIFTLSRSLWITVQTRGQFDSRIARSFSVALPLSTRSAAPGYD